jgi:hypothetical protein
MPSSYLADDAATIAEVHVKWWDDDVDAELRDRPNDWRWLTVPPGANRGYLVACARLVPGYDGGGEGRDDRRIGVVYRGADTAALQQREREEWAAEIVARSAA